MFHDWLFSALQGKGTRKPILTRIMVSRSEIDMKQIKEDYKKNYGKTLHQDILVSKHLKVKPIPDVQFWMDCAYDGKKMSKENM